MKRFLSIFLAVILIISMTACNNVPEPDHTEAATIETVDETTANEDINKEGTADPEETVEPTEANHEHAYVETVIVPTCIEDGCIAYVCECGDSYNDNYVDAVGHAWGDWVEVVKPTEEAEGKAERMCTACNQTETKGLPKVVKGHNHKYTETVTKKATCEKAGEKTFACDCGHKYTESIEKLAHEYDKTVTEPTCTTRGYTTNKCKNCSYSYKSSYVSAKEHNYTSKVTVEPTCSKVGTMTYTCECGKSYTADIDKTAHDYDSKVVNPTCEERGYTKYTCKCGDTYKENYVNANGHKWSDWKTTKESTETSEGSAERVCSTCNKKDTKSLPKIVKDHVHKYDEKVTKVATCAAEGVKTFTCSCGDSYTENIAKLTHSYESSVIASTCAQKGYTEYVCSGCGDAYRDTYTDKFAHNYNSKVTREATCSKVGVRTYECSVCGDTYTEDIEKTKHVYSETVTQPTCNEEGYTTYKCDECGHTTIDNKVAAIGHTYNNVVTNPTCTEGGYTTQTCTRCGYSSVTDKVSANGHSYKVESNTATCTSGGTKTEVCSVCGDQKTFFSEATGHTETKTESVEATCVSDGYTKVVCASCGELISNTVIPAGVGHTYETKKLSNAAKVCVDQGDNFYLEYTKFKDWTVSVCKHCDYIDLETMKFAYSDSQAASTMLGYVNGLRESVHGTSDYNLELNSTLVELAKIRAKELSVNFGHGGTYTGAGENITNSGKNIYDHYSAWLNSSGHYANMIEPQYKYFGYAIYKPDDWRNTVVYGVQLFWQE